MKEMKIRGCDLAVHLTLMGAVLLRKELDEGGHTIYVYALTDEQIAELKSYVQNKQRNHF